MGAADAEFGRFSAKLPGDNQRKGHKSPTIKKLKDIDTISLMSKPVTIFKSLFFVKCKRLSINLSSINFVVSININKNAGTKNDWPIKYFHHIPEYSFILGKIIPKKAIGEKIITAHKTTTLATTIIATAIKIKAA